MEKYESVLLAGGAGVMGAGTGLFSGWKSAFGQDGAGGLTKGDVATLRFLATAELIESDLWTQYAELGGIGNKLPIEVDLNRQLNSYQAALSNLDSDGPQYITSNTIDEISHATLLNYLESKGTDPVDFSEFETLQGSAATETENIGRLTNLQHLNVDTSWFIRYDSATNPDLGATLRRAINLTNRTASHITDADFNNPHIQMIANTAAFHFGYIEQGGASLYQALSQKAIRAAFVIAVGFAGLMAVFPRAKAQMIVPVDRTLHPPDGFDFSGQWNCGDGVSIAHVDVKNRNRSSGGAAFRPEGGTWTEIRESQDGFNGDYYVGYDRDKSQFLMIDADDPASVAYSTEGWNGNKLLLTSTNDKGQLGLPHRIQYDVDDSRQFTVTWEILEGTAWKADPGFKCTKVGRRGSIPPKR